MYFSDAFRWRRFFDIDGKIGRAGENGEHICFLKNGVVMRKNRLNILAMFALIGVVYIFASKLTSTLFQGFYGPAAFAGVVIGLNILAGAAQLLFFIELYRVFVSRNKSGLRNAGIWAVAGSAIALAPKLTALGIYFGLESLYFLIKNNGSIGIFFPWLSSFLLFSACLTVLIDSDIRQNADAKKAFAAGAIGWFLLFAVQTLVFVYYLSGEKLAWLDALLRSGRILFVGTSTAAILCLVLFYRAFIRKDLFRDDFTVSGGNHLTKPGDVPS